MVVGAPDPNIDLSVIIVNWNTCQLLQNCLSSIRQHGDEIYVQIVVVDNASHDGSAEMVRQSFPEVILLVNERNRGFASANNQGLRHATGRYFLLLNSDTVVLPGAFDAMVRYLDSNPEVGVLGPRLLTADRSLQLSTRDFPRLDHDLVILLDVNLWPIIGDVARRSAQRLYGAAYTHTHIVDWVQGSCMMLRRAAVEVGGGLDEHYFFDYEEPDLCKRYKRQGWNTVFLAEAEIIHLGGQSRSKVRAVSIIWHYRSMLRYYRIHESATRYQVVRWGIAIGAALHVMWGLFWPKQTQADRNRWAAYAHVCVYAATHRSTIANKNGDV